MIHEFGLHVLECFYARFVQVLPQMLLGLKVLRLCISRLSVVDLNSQFLSAGEFLGSTVAQPLDLLEEIVVFILKYRCQFAHIVFIYTITVH